MSGYLKYYQVENQRHALVESVKLDFEAIKRLNRVLFTHFGVEPITVTLLDQNTKRFSRVKKTKSWYSSHGTKELVYHPSMLTPLTVAHEVAHYLHDLDRRKRYTEARAKWEAARREADANGRPFSYRFPMKNEKWHGPEHRRFVDEGVEVLKKALPQYFAETPEAEVARDELKLQELLRTGTPAPVTTSVLVSTLVHTPDSKDVVQKFFETLPEKLTCPCCKAHIPKQNFGVRVMKRDANGVPTKMRAQSWCRACR